MLSLQRPNRPKPTLSPQKTPGPASQVYPLRNVAHVVGRSGSASALIALLRGQDQDVLGHVINATEGRMIGPEGRLLAWLVDQPLELANAVRLFWALWRPEVYVVHGQHEAAGGQANADRRALLRRLSQRIAAGSYPKGALGLTARQAKHLRLRLVQDTEQARHAGWDPLQDAAFEIPDACLAPLPGRALTRIAPQRISVAMVGADPLAPVPSALEPHIWAVGYLRHSLAKAQDLPEAADEARAIAGSNRRVSMVGLAVLAGALVIVGIGIESSLRPAPQHLAQAEVLLQGGVSDDAPMRGLP